MAEYAQLPSTGRRRREATLICGGDRVTEAVPDGGFYVRPAIVKVPGNLEIVREETFAPILYVMSYRHIEEAIRASERSTAGPQLRDIHKRCARGRMVPLAFGFRLRDRQYKHRNLRR